MNQGTCLVNRSRQTFNIDKQGKEWFNGMCYSSSKELLIGYSNLANLYIIKIDNQQSSKMTIYQTINDFCKNSMFVSNTQQSLGRGIFLKGYKPTSNNLIDKKPMIVENYSITDISSNTPYVFICSFSNSSIKAFDLRLPLSKTIWTMNTNPNEGLISCLAEGNSCVFAGTCYGHIVTFDTRFQLRSNVMSYRVQRKIHRLLYTPKGLYAAVAGYNEVSLWDCESSTRVKTLWASNAPPLSNQISPNSVYGLVSSNYQNNDFQGVITSGTDARIRYWDLLNPHNSYIVVDNYFRNSSTVSNLSNQSNSPNLNRSTNVSYMNKIIEGMQLIQEYDHNPTPTATTSQQQSQNSTQQKDNLNSQPNNFASSYNNFSSSWNPQDISPAHKNIITDIIWLNKSNVLVSGSRDGCVKLWK